MIYPMHFINSFIDFGVSNCDETVTMFNNTTLVLERRYMNEEVD